MCWQVKPANPADQPGYPAQLSPYSTLTLYRVNSRDQQDVQHYRTTYYLFACLHAGTCELYAHRQGHPVVFFAANAKILDAQY
jgi:hypothetical protein